MPLLDFLSALFLHLDETLSLWVQTYGALVYGMLFLVIFMETGLVVTPFLPGDSLLFAAGALAGAGNMNIAIVVVTILAAATIGDNTNYWIGRVFGDRILASERARRFVNPKYVGMTRQFFSKHGGKSITLARFFPFVRTFAPFMAGVGEMHWPRFFAFSFAGTIAWTGIFVGVGYFFGNIPWVKDNFEVAVMGIIAFTLLPFVYHGVKSWWAGRKAARVAVNEAVRDVETRP